ncbi:response regulator [Pseudodesulfovibrio sp. F-1]|uniref:Response regulator n=1 Tax=Pseudodesulfovibrio alkaliphilus TaxID=2661613 RepID=A0A7K1KIY2_9BACT|nr:response regulator [Pseudodesulfovibrio alkaliphilus]MUM76033.1 response regulator [Pseudodesulfovibrio alkaliphilus]
MSEIRVMLVDDEPAFLNTLKKRLVHRKFSVSTAQCGEECLALLKQAPVDVVILDVKMPVMDGIEVLGEIVRRMPRVAVVLLTGHADSATAVGGIEGGAFDYLLKPVAIDDLVNAIQGAYESKQLGGSSGSKASKRD